MSLTMMCPQCWGAGLFNRKKCAYCGGDGIAEDEQLSKNFYLSEFLRSETAVRNRIANVPDATMLANMRRTAIELLQPIRDEFGPLTVSSALRIPSLNSHPAIGGVTTSAHCEGNAVDFNPLSAQLTRKEICNWIVANKATLKYDQMIYEGTWIHIGRLKKGRTVPRGDDLMMFGGTYFQYDPNDKRVH